MNNPCFEGYRFHCESTDDQCVVHDDCGERSGASCVYEAEAFVCRTNSGPVCGRPFLVEGEARTAQLARRADWRGDDRLPELHGLSAADRRALADHYGRAAQLEHASIAAFARFSLQLVSLGAPPELIEACAAAMADEARHARTCFASPATTRELRSVPRSYRSTTASARRLWKRSCAS